MTTRLSRFFLLLASAASIAGLVSTTHAREVLVADRLTDSVYRYSTGGTFLGTLVTDSVLINEPTGIVASPDLTKLYVSSSVNDTVVRYDYNFQAGSVSNPFVFATSANGLDFPNALLFSKDGTKLYVANLNNNVPATTGIVQLNATGGNAGPNLLGGSSSQFSGLTYAPTGELLAGGFLDATFSGGTVAKSNAAISSLSDLVPTNAAIFGAAGLLVHGNDLYVTGLLAGTVVQFNASTGAFQGIVGGAASPQGLMDDPNSNGGAFLLGVLGATDGTGNISRYAYNGAPMGIFASPNPGNGFTEATAFTLVPEPGSLTLAGIALLAMGLVVRRRAAR